ncbi:MAG: hypothetical protein CMJ18_19430 [Phycisphaeraceae bacterium]|nr:hypothetical protein [Phycisphaeraceae bacterium]
MSQLTAELCLPCPGAVVNDDRVSFTAFFPNVKTVHLVGDFNGWSTRRHPMREVADGWWTIELPLGSGLFRYQFCINGKMQICDPYARCVKIDSRNEVCEAIVDTAVPLQPWCPEDWSAPDFRDLVIYEMHIPDFTPRGTLDTAIDRLDHVRRLGVNAIQLMPVTAVMSRNGWGYEPIGFFAPNPDYGSPDELRWFIDEAHGRGLSVLLDMVLAHSGHDHPFNRIHWYHESPWYGEGPIGKNDFGLPQFCYAKAPTRAFARDVLRYWLEHYGVDGFRFDYIRNIGVTPKYHGIPTLIDAARSVRDGVHLIGEHLPEDPGLMIRVGLDGAWHARFCHALRALLCEKSVHHYRWEDFAGAVQVLDPCHEGYGERPSTMVNYLESHDEDRVVWEIVRSGFDEHTARRKSALGATILFTAVGQPMIYHGIEWGQNAAKDMDDAKLDWKALREPGGGGLFWHYRRLAWLRRKCRTLRTDHISLDLILPKQKSLVYHRWDDEGGQVVVAANFSGDEQTIDVPFPLNGGWGEFFKREVIEVAGPLRTEIGPWAAKIYVRQPGHGVLQDLQPPDH